ncbi:abortive infection family protein [Plantactinospora sp. CA-294935]|uniref:abortive infection family protein n=1 Tax=Plantactinospora sp. CA-294935 TaxID=3240012 RepID=UPI003D90DA94
MVSGVVGGVPGHAPPHRAQTGVRPSSASSAGCPVSRLASASLRNEGWGAGHAARRTGLRARHGYLAVGAAHTWCQVILDTLADPTAPWRTHTAAATAG